MDAVGGFAKIAACRCCAPLESEDDDDPPMRTADAGDTSETDEALLSDLAALSASTVFDSHCHTHASSLPSSERRYFAVVQAVEEEDWDRVLARCAASSRLRPGLGVHPWQAHRVEDVDAYLGRLEAALKRHEAAIVGEIGLCKCAKNVRGPKETREAGLEQQRKVFAGQLALAVAMGRPASVHAVKQHTPLKTALATAAEAASGVGRWGVALHSFSGTAYHVNELLNVVGDAFPLFFGFSHTINVAMNGSRGLPALHAAIAAVPDDRLLVESDVEDAATARAATCRALRLICDAKGWGLADAAAKTADNARAWLGLDRARSEERGPRLESEPRG